MQMLPPNDNPIRCVRCDYDLRGFSEPSPRCPECGFVTTRTDYQRHISTQGVDLSKRAVHAGFLNVPIFLFAVLGAVSSLEAVSTTCLVLFGGAWIYQVARFFGACGWSSRLLFRFLFVQFAMFACLAVCVLCTPCIVLVAGMIIEWNVRQHPVSWSQTIGLTLLTIMGVVAAVAILIYVTLLSFQWAFQVRSKLAELVSRQLLNRTVDR